MEKKDLFLLLLGFCGWGWGVIQFIINRRNQKRDKLSDRRYEAYSAYMKNCDDLMNNIRTDPKISIDIISEYRQILSKGDQNQINEETIKITENIRDLVKNTIEQSNNLNKELNSLMLICSKTLLTKIKELKQMSCSFNNEMKAAINRINVEDISSLIKQFVDLLNSQENNERWQRLKNLNDEIIFQMRKELNVK